MENKVDKKQFTKTVLFTYIVFIVVGIAIIPFTPQLDFIARWQDPLATWTVTFFQLISDSISYISFGVPLGITVAKEFQSNSNKKQSRLSFLYLLLSIAIAGLISRIIKESLGVPRPYEIDPRIAQLSVGGGYSLPSGHTTEAFAAAMALSLLFPKWIVVFPAFSWAVLVALSRIYLGVHYPFDIFVGMFIGSSVSILFYTYYFQKKLISYAKTIS